MKVSSTVGCCPCSWPYFFTLPYISRKKKGQMDEPEKPASLLVNSADQSLLPMSNTESASSNSPSDTAESLKSPNMSTDSGFEGENNRPLLLQTNLPSPSEETLISSWRKDVIQARVLEIDVPDLKSPKSPKKSMEDSDFESPFDKKSVPSVGDIQLACDNESTTEHHCAFFTTGAWCNDEDEKAWLEENKAFFEEGNGMSAIGVCLVEEINGFDEPCHSKGQESQISLAECLTSCNGSFPGINNTLECRQEETCEWGISALPEAKDQLLYAETGTEVNSDYEYEHPEKADTETDDASDERNFDGTFSDETLSAYYVPSATSVATEEYQIHPPVPPPRGIRLAKLKREGTQSEADADVSSSSVHRADYKSLRSQSEPSRYTTVLKPKAVRPPPVNLDRVEYRSSLESLHSGRIVAVLGQHDRFSAFRERPRSSLSQSEDVHFFFSRSLETPPPLPPSRNSSQRLIAAIDSSIVGPSNSIVSHIPDASGHIASLNDISSVVHPANGVINARESDKINVQDEDSGNSQNSESSVEQTGAANTGDTCSSTQAKRHSMPWDLFWSSEAARKFPTDYDPHREPIHMTLEEVRSSLQTLSPGGDQDESLQDKSASKRTFRAYLRQKKSRKEDRNSRQPPKIENDKACQRKSFPFSIKAALTTWFGLKKTHSADPRFSASHSKSHDELSSQGTKSKTSPSTSPFTNRALPPLPVDGSSIWEPSVTVEEEPWSADGGLSQMSDGESQQEVTRRKMDYAASIERVKDCGWYWGPISGETAEKLLASEPDGSFVVRDSSDEHYIFSLTFKLNGLVRHVRIEHDHGNFSFGCLQKFRSNTIVDFIENAVAHSRSGRYLFFLHRRPVLGPMRVQLLHPVSRFKQVQSLQHLCRFVILKTVRRDLIDTLPLPRRLKDYLNTPHYYSEELANLSLQSKKYQEVKGTNAVSSQQSASSEDRNNGPVEASITTRSSDQQPGNG